MSEAQLLRGVLKALAAKRVWHWRNNAGLTVLGKGKARRVIRGAPAGSPDILLVVPGSAGQLGAVELKTAKGRVSETQLAWASEARKHGVRYGVARSVSEALELVEAWKAGALTAKGRARGRFASRHLTTHSRAKGAA